MGIDALGRTPLADLLAVADTKWVLGHWYIKVMHNGRSVADFSSLAGIVQEELGQTRSIFRYLEEAAELQPGTLEHGREAHEIRSMHVLDRPPSGWGDFIATMAVAELATLSLCDVIAERLTPEEELRGLLDKVFQEEYFHELLVRGWLQTLTGDDLTASRAALSGDRLVGAFAWFGQGGGPVFDAARSGFETRLRDVLGESGVGDGEVVAKALDQAQRTAWDRWDGLRQRPSDTALPTELWEFMVPTSEAALMARRPRDVALEDDFSTAGKSFDEYVQEGQT